LGFDYKTALRKLTTEYEYVTKNEKPEPYADFAARVFNNVIDNIEENIKENKNVKVTLKARAKLSDGDNKWFSTTRFEKDLNQYTSREDLRKLIKNGFEETLNNDINEWSDHYQHRNDGRQYNRGQCQQESHLTWRHVHSHP
jgi:predicted DNA-binding protein